MPDHLRVVLVVDVGGGRVRERAGDDDAGVAPVLELRPRLAEPAASVRHSRRRRDTQGSRHASILHRQQIAVTTNTSRHQAEASRE